MAISNRDRVGKALEALREPLITYVESQLQSHLGSSWKRDFEKRFSHKGRVDYNKDGSIHWDNYNLLRAIDIFWNDVFVNSLDKSHRSWVNEILDVRNKHCHDHGFSSDEARRALDTIQLFLEAISASDYAKAVKTIQYDLIRTVFSEEARTQTRKVAKVQGVPEAGLKPWREIVTPHKDVSSGNYQKAEFAADLAEVHRGEASIEYQNPVEFYRRTHLTQGITDLLKNALKRICRGDGDPVIDLQTNFGGGKTHSMLALYHLFTNGSAASYPGVEPILKEVGIESLCKVNKAVLVGTALSPGQSRTKPDGTVINTLWGELAWQLGNCQNKGSEAYKLLEECDKNSISPGSDELVTLFKAYSPALILIDEWVAYIRQTYNTQGLPGGTYEANISFTQALTEAVKASPNTLLIASLPASNIEAGGEGGKQALIELQHVFNRVQSSWRPANAQESYEIIRRRLFEPLTGNEHVLRDTVINAFIKMYKSQENYFPSECKEYSYQVKMESCYPIHPELFEQLYENWSSLVKFQQTRGVLRLMASVIHSLWESGDKSLLIMPSSIPMDDRNICDTLTYYLPDGWKAVIDKDIDGNNALPILIDQDNPNLGRYSAARRVARSIFIASAPIEQSGNQGIDDKKISLACAQPGEAIPTFSDTALRRLEEKATYLYQEARKYWFSTQPSVDQLARERALQFLQDNDKINQNILKFLKGEADNRKRADFTAVQVVGLASEEVPDEKEVRLVILGPEFPAIRNSESSPARLLCQQILDKRGNAPRIYKNMLVFLTPDQSKISDLEEAISTLMAWQSIHKEVDKLDLKGSEKAYVERKNKESESTVELRIKETWIWCLFPYQTPEAINKIEWEEIKLLNQQDSLAAKVCKKLKDEEHLLTTYGPDRLKLDLERFPFLWQDKNHIEVRQLWEFFATYLYLPRLKNQQCLFDAISNVFNGYILLDRFAYATGYNEQTRNYLGLVAEGNKTFTVSLSGLVVKARIAEAQLDRNAEEKRQQEEERRRKEAEKTVAASGNSGIITVVKPPEIDVVPAPVKELEKVLPKRFYASINLDPDRIGRDAGKIAEEVVQHLSILPNSNVNITMEVQISIPDGVDDHTLRTVTENCKTLKFKDFGFEK